MKNVFAAIAISFTLLFVGCTKDNTVNTTDVKSITKSGVGDLVKYEVNCSPAGFLVIYKDSTGTTVQKSISADSWTVSFTGHASDSVYVSAKANNKSATISTKIYYKGNVLSQGTASGDYSTAKGVGKL